MSSVPLSQSPEQHRWVVTMGNVSPRSPSGGLQHEQSLSAQTEWAGTRAPTTVVTISQINDFASILSIPADQLMSRRPLDAARLPFLHEGQRKMFIFPGSARFPDNLRVFVTRPKLRDRRWLPNSRLPPRHSRRWLLIAACRSSM